ncbi:fructose permease [Fructobacillus sp. M158]|uniref:fructose permease n=1 Tax=Fructobacillus parabroussonetiae TaxID=2713174 RepID=UPI00200B8F05|nr:fructose permease [Fructobacillus parabroussonetiae]MCK8617295.1 fructose permease [Fructobacillus parabroussonetiae]
MQKSNRTISWGTAIAYFAFSLVINSMGNVLTIATSQKIHPAFLGSAYWTAAENGWNMSFMGNTASGLSWVFFIVGVLIAILNMILDRKLNWWKFFGNIAFMVPFSLLINVFSNWFNSIMPEAHGLGMVIFYVFLNFLGVSLIAVAISIYQRANVVLHPADDLMQILRFKYFKGNAGVAMWFSYIPPTIIGVVALIALPNFSNYGLGTIFAFLFQGSITGWGDKHIFPKLKHQGISASTEV